MSKLILVCNPPKMERTREKVTITGYLSPGIKLPELTEFGQFDAKSCLQFPESTDIILWVHLSATNHF